MNAPNDHAQQPVWKTLAVDPQHEGDRLDRYLVQQVPDLSRARVKALIESGNVRVNGRRARKGDAVSAGATIELLAEPAPKDFSPVAEEGALVVRYDEADVVAIDKPAGIPTHPLRPDETGTMANRIVAQWPEMREVGFARREPGLLHRLDTDTSGLLLLARTQDVFERLRAAMREGHVHKRYLAVVEGRVPAEGRVDYPLVPHRKDPKRVEAVTPHVRLRAGTKTHEAETRYRPVRTLRAPDGTEFTLIEIELERAFRHQIRVHLASVGHPLLGDALYRGPIVPAEVPLTRHFLHASEITFPHPVSGDEVRVTAPLPKELVETVTALGGR